MPGSVRLAIGVIAAAMLLGAAENETRRVALLIALGVGAAIPAGWLVSAWLRRPGLVRTISPALAGAGLIALRLLAAPPDIAPADVQLPAGVGPWTAAVVSVGPLRAGDRPAVIELRAPAGLRLAATFPAWPMVVPGDTVEIDGELEARPDDEYGAYLVRIGAAGVVRARSVALVGPAPGVARTLEGLRRAADEALARAVPEPEAGLASGILIGLRDRVDRDLATAFTAVGASHVVAISGWNIAIVAATLGALAGRVARRRRAALTAVAIVAYVIFVGATPSVVRAAAMAGVVLLARELGRPSHAAAAIGWAVTLMLLADPRLVDDVGFRLSALATAGLIAWGALLSARLAGAAPGRARAWLAESLGVSLAAQLATLPVVALEFGRLSLVAPVVGLGVVPLVAPAMATGAIALAAGALTFAGAPMPLATLGGLPAWALLAAIVGLVRAGASIPFASLTLAPPWDVVAAATAAAAIMGTDRLLRRLGRGRPEARSEPTVGAPSRHAAASTTAAGRSAGPGGGGGGAGRNRRGRQISAGRLVAGGLAVAVVALAIAFVHRPDGIARLIVLDVGQGDAILLEGERGSRLLVDGGPDPGRLLVALDEQLPPWDRRVDAVVLTHPHADHDDGLPALIGRYRVERLLEPGMIGPGPGYAALNAALADGAIRRGTLATGDRLSVDDITLRILWPDAGTVPEQPPATGKEINNLSIVLLGEAGRHRFLLTGDVEEEVDPILLARGLPTVEILKVAHHGSRTASTGPFLSAARPAVAVISSGRGNSYGHPATPTLERLEATGARVLRTDTVGSVEIELDPGPLRIRTKAGRTTATAVPPPMDAIRRPLADAPEALRYHAGRDALDPDPTSRTGDVRSRRLLLGRRRVWNRCGRGGAAERSGPLPGRRPGAVAPSRRGNRHGPAPRRAARASRHRDDVRVRDPGGPRQRGPARPAGRGSRRARRGDRPARRR